jgi:hypothetical protein
MFNRLLACIGMALAIVAALVEAPAMAQSPSSSPSPAPARIIAVGDLHGDFNAWRQIATASGIMDAKGNWAGGTTVFVQTGDVPDRGPDTLKIIADLQRLQKQAPKAGGQVFTLLGNHEAMNITGDLRYVSAAEYAAFVTPGSTKLRDKYYAANEEAIGTAYRARGNPDMTDFDIRNAWLATTPLGKIEHQIAWDPKGKIGSWVVGNPAVLQLDDTIFVHGGLSAAHAGKPIDHINRTIKDELMARNTVPEALVNEQNGPLWYRGLARKSGEAPTTEDGQPVAAALPAVDAELDTVLKAYGANRIVIGHTPQLAGISLRENDRLILIDTGISAYYGGKVSWLEITDGKPVPHDVPRATTGAKP